MTMIIHCDKLTTCGAIGNGEALHLDMVTVTGEAVSVLFSFHQAQSIALTLPRLLTQAMIAQSGQDKARYVFPLGQWVLERAEDRNCCILTLKTSDGFAVSFRVPLETCRALGWTLSHEGKGPAEHFDLGTDAPDAHTGRFSKREFN